MFALVKEQRSFVQAQEQSVQGCLRFLALLESDRSKAHKNIVSLQAMQAPISE